MQALGAPYPWAEELERTVVHSLATSFGLDFLLFKDKEGGQVDTVRNVRKGVYASEAERVNYEQRGAYSSQDYHKDRRFIERGRADARRQAAGRLKDGYTNLTMVSKKGVRDLDHVQAAKAIHDDAGRVLAGVPGVKLANDDTNLVSTHRSINRSKQAASIEEFVTSLPERIKREQSALAKERKTLDALPRGTPREREIARRLQDKIRKTEDKVEQWLSVDPKAMRKKDREARKHYNGRVNREYYTGTKFLGATLQASGSAGLRMGTRQMVGLILAEVWFELRQALPKIAGTMRRNFSLSTFVKEVRTTLSDAWKRVRSRFRSFLTTFKDGALAGVLGSVTTTVLNIFATTAKNAIKIIREMWSQLVAALKLWIFNPEKLSGTDLAKAVLGVLSVGVATVVGSLVYAQLAPILAFPFGQELAAFAGALVTGVVTMGMHFVLSHSKMMRRIWDCLEQNRHARTLRQFQALNAQLDENLAEIARLELNIDVEALENFDKRLGAARTEKARATVLQREVQRRKIKLPFDAKVPGGTRRWLVSLAK